jgi:hypothetical protein
VVKLDIKRPKSGLKLAALRERGEDMDEWSREKLPDMLADIRETELPGRRGGASHYAGAVRACFAEIQGLIGEGFTLFTICKYLEKKGVLPPGADARSFCRAFGRERSRRERPTKWKKAKIKEKSVKNDNTAKMMDATAAKQEPGLSPQQCQSPIKSGARLQINPDNTFKIEPIDLDDLPDFENLTKRRDGA